MAEQTKKAWYKKWWVWVIAVLVLAGIGGAMSGGGTAETQGAEQSSQKQEQSSQQTESPTPVASIVYDAELGSGNYTSGIDFPAGTYDIEVVSGNGNVSSDNQFDGGINAIMGVKDDDLYQKSYSNISLPEDTLLRISGGVVVKIHSEDASGAALSKREQPNTEEIELSNGNFVAGTDFPAGVYDIQAVSGNGNVSSDNIYSGGLNAIMGVKNDELYEKEYKNISLEEGVTLKIDGVKIKLVPSK